MNEHYTVKIEPEGDIHIIEAGKDEFFTDFCYKQIGCEIFERVHPKGLKCPYVMIVDEEGAIKDSPKANLLAGYLYRTHQHGVPIFGNALIMRDTSSGADITWLTNEQAIQIVSCLMLVPEKAISDVCNAVLRYRG